MGAYSTLQYNKVGPSSPSLTQPECNGPPWLHITRHFTGPVYYVVTDFLFICKTCLAFLQLHNSAAEISGEVYLPSLHPDCSSSSIGLCATGLSEAFVGARHRLLRESAGK